MKGFEFPDSSQEEQEENVVELNNNTTNVDNENSYNYYPVEDESEAVNSNPYEETVINTNPYQNVKIEEVITEEKPVVEKEVPNPTPVPTPPPVLTEDEITNRKIAQIKAERKTKFKQLQGIFLVFMAVIIVMLIVIYAKSDKSKEKIIIEPVDIHTTDDKPVEEMNITKELEDYYATREKTNIEKILVDNADNPEKINEINTAALAHIDKLIDDIIIASKDYMEFDQKTNDLIQYMGDLKDIEFNDVSILKEIDYESSKTKIDDIKAMSNSYYTGISYYNSKDYNNAYETFKNIPEDNYFRKLAKIHLDGITDEIIGLLKSDIDNLSTNLKYLDEAEKKVKYSQIKSIIEQYGKAYPYLHLETNQTYNELLSEYSSLSS